MWFCTLDGGSCGSSADNPANVQCVVVGSCARVLKATFESLCIWRLCLRLWIEESPTSHIQLFRERLSYKRGETYATMSKVIMGNKNFTVPWVELKVFQLVEGNSLNPCIHNFSFLLSRHREPQSISAKLLLPIIPIGIVAYAFTLLLDNLYRNSCLGAPTLLGASL